MEIKNLFIQISGIILNILVAWLTVMIFIGILKAKNNLVGKAFDRTKGLTSRARERAQSSGFYQRRELARNQRKGERQRSATEGYANAITYQGGNPFRRARAARLQQRAGGFNAAAQNRAYISGVGALERLESQEDKDATTLLKYRSIQRPDELAVIAAGGAVRGTSGAANPALQRAAIRKIIGAQDAGAMESLFLPPGSVGAPPGAPGVDMAMLMREIQDDYSQAKGAGAHFVTMTAAHGPYTRPQINAAAVEALSALAPAKLATQDGPAVESAVNGYAAAPINVQRALYDKLLAVYSNPQTLDSVKGSARTHLDNLGLFAAPAVPGAPPQILVPRP